MNRQNWIIYGAYGYTGELIVREALAHGKRPILAGRNETRLKPLADKFELPSRVFSVQDAAEHLHGADTLINCAGPFAATAEQMMDACLEKGLHYFDITGEIPVFQSAHKRHEDAVKAGVILCPGVGFDIVPTDCLAALLKQALPEATHLELAFDFGTLPSMGTTRTAIKGIGDGGMVRKDGELQKVGLGYRIRKIPYPRGKKWSVSLPWGDVFTARISTGIPNTVVYGALPLVACWMQRMTNPLSNWLARPGMQKWLISLAGKFLRDGPDDRTRANTRTNFWGRVTTVDGRECTGTITGPNVYTMTAETTIAIVLDAEKCRQEGGYYTASLLAGADFLSKREGYEVKISRKKGVTPDG